MKKLLLCLFLTFCWLSVSAEELPVESFVHLPMITQPIVSPDGEHIAALVNNGRGYYDVVVAKFGSTQLTSIARLEKAEDRIDFITWANNERLLISASIPWNYGRKHYRLPRLYAVNYDGSDSIQIQIPGKRNRENFLKYQSDIISTLKNDDEHILLNIKGEYDEYPNVYKVNIYTNEFDKLFSNDYEISTWYTNENGDVLWGIQYYENDESKSTIWHRKNTEAKWQPLKTHSYLGEETFDPIVFDESGKYLFVFSNHDIGRTGLWKYNVKEEKWAELVFAADGYDISSVIMRHDRIVGVRWYEDYLKQHYFSEDDARIYKLVQNTFKGAEVTIASDDDKRKKFVISAIRDDTPRKYYLLDLENKKATLWFSQYPHLEGKLLTKKMPYEYTARDGMKLNGYLTLPVVAEAEKPPLIVMPHGGPFTRDYRYFDYEAQLFANRGYAVLQMNFRGSSGFGDAYEQAGFKQLGGKMQTDVLDAIEWVEKTGKVDTENMCLVGWSYGGYVALTASFQTPELFKCIVSIAGISDLYEMTVNSGWVWTSENINAHAFGDPAIEEDKKRMELNSAINHVKEIKRPILLIHGTSDVAVSFTQSEKFYDKAEIFDKDVTFLKIDQATHNLNFEPNRIEAFEAIDEFLKDHLH